MDSDVVECYKTKDVNAKILIKSSFKQMAANQEIRFHWFDASNQVRVLGFGL